MIHCKCERDGARKRCAQRRGQQPNHHRFILGGDGFAAGLAEGALDKVDGVGDDEDE